jgi:hypothetical protein
MHAPPPFQITVRRFGAWRLVCGWLVAVAAAVTVWWARAAIDAHVPWLAASTLLLVGASGALLSLALRLRPMSLRWDGQMWHLGPAATAGQEPKSGRVAVALDLGSWMLLRFWAAGSRRGQWLPVQRRGHELGWHALRATVYCARPVSLPAAAPF